MKKVLAVYALLLSSAALLGAQKARNQFDTVGSYHECIHNCRMQHHTQPDWYPGKWRGECLDMCESKHNDASHNHYHHRHHATKSVKK